MSEKYSTGEMIRWLKSYCLFGSNRDAIIAKLRAADKLCEVAKRTSIAITAGLAWDYKPTALVKAIADYEEGRSR